HRPGQRKARGHPAQWPHLGRSRARQGRYFPLHSPSQPRPEPTESDRMTAIRTILLAEDSPHDAEMAVDALRDAHLANPIVHVEDGVEALDYLFRRGKFADRPEGDPAVLLLDIKMPRMDGLE